MGKLSYLYNDYVKDLTAGNITLINEDTNYPTENSQHEDIGKTTRTTDKVNILYQMDMGAVKAPQIFFLGNHNLTSGSVKIYSYSDAAFSANQKLEATFTYRAMDMYIRLSSAPSPARQYWEYDFSKNGTAAASGHSYFEFGRPMIYSDLVQITEIPDYITNRGYGCKNIINSTKYEVRHVHKLTPPRERFEFGWNEREITNSPAAELRTLYYAVNGNASPFVLIPDLSLVACYYGYIEDPEMLWSEIMGVGSDAHVGNVALRFIEAVRGKA